jgi:hypothetical protein
VRRRWRTWAASVLGVYVVLWTVTAIWGPAAMVARQRGYEDTYYGAMRVDPEERRSRLHGFVVPVPFVVLAEWEAGNSDGRQSSYSHGDQWGVWLPGWFWVVRHRATLIACGIVPITER